MPQQFGLYYLIEQDPAIKQYYHSLPDHIRDQISQKADQIQDGDAFAACVEQLLDAEG